jgi:hypothetical protein
MWHVSHVACGQCYNININDIWHINRNDSNEGVYGQWHVCSLCSAVWDLGSGFNVTRKCSMET